MSKQLSLSAHISTCLMALLALAMTLGSPDIEKTRSAAGDSRLAAFQIGQ